MIVDRDGLRGVDLNLTALLQDILTLDRKLYGHVDPVDIGTVEQWRPIFDEHPDTWRALVRNRQVVGYWQVAPLPRLMFDAVTSGAIRIRDLRSTHYQCLNRPGFYPLHFVSVCLDESARSAANQFALLSSFLETIAGLAERGVRFDRVSAFAHSGEGRRLCEVLGLRPLPEPVNAHPLFMGSLDEATGAFRGQLARRHFARPELAPALAA